MDINKKQLDDLNDLLNYSNKHVKYYREVFKSAGLVKAMDDKIELQSISELEKLPILTKEIINEHFENLKSDQIDQFDTFVNSSGGSTGEKALFIQDSFFNLCSSANFLYFLDQIGVKPWGNFHMLLWGSTKDIGIPTVPSNLIKCLFNKNSVVVVIHRRFLHCVCESQAFCSSCRC